MKFRSRIIIFVLPLLLLWGCDCIEGQGELLTEKRDISGFDSIELDMSARIILSQEEEYSLMIEAQQNILDVITTRVDDNELEIDIREACVSYSEPVTIFISMPNIRGLEVNSSGKIISKRSINTEKIYIELDGSGDIYLELRAEKVKAEIDGSGEIELGGNTRDLSVEIDGSGEFYGLNLKSNEADVDISGSGNCTVYVLRKLNAEIDGSGDLRYKGEPDVNADISGSGRINKIK